MIGPSFNLVEIVKNITNGQTDAIRKNAEYEYQHIVSQCPQEFMEVACKEFQNIGLSPSIRMTIATLIKIALRPRDRENNASIWLQLRPELRQTAKDTALACLIDPAEQVRKSAASFTATIFVCDLLSDNSWSNLLQNLADNILNPQIQIKKTAIETLGFICEILNFDNILNLDPSKVHALLTGICAGLNTYSEISNTAVLALSNSLEFLKRELDKSDLREYIFNVMIEILIGSAKNSDFETTRNTLLCLGEIIKMVFNFFEPYAQTTIEKVMDCYKIPDDTILIALNEFFMKLIRAEIFHRTNYFDSEWRMIAMKAIEILMFKTEKTDAIEDEDCLAVILSIIHLLTTINELKMHDSFVLYNEFICGYIVSDLTNQKLSALLVFESLLEYTDEKTIETLLSDSFRGLLNYLENEPYAISLSCAVILRKIAQYHPYIFLKDNNLERTLVYFRKFLSERPNQEKIIKTKKCLCVCLQFIAEKNERSGLAVSVFSTFMDSYFDLFFQVARSTTDLSFVECLFSTTFALIQHVLEKGLHNPYFQSFYKLLNATESCNGDPQIKKTMIEDIFMNMNAILTKMLHMDIPMEVPGMENFRFLDQVYHNIIKIFEDYNEIISEGLALMATIVNYAPSHFFQYIETFMQRFVKPAIDDPSNYELFKVGLESLSYICKRFPKNFKIYFNEMTSYIITNLQNMSIKRNLKVAMFMVLGDFAMSCPSSMPAFVPVILNLCDLALSAVINFLGSNDIEDQAYAIELRDSIMDCYFCIIHGLSSNRIANMPEFEKSFSKLQEFIEITCRKENEPTVEYVKVCIMLMFDFCSQGINLNQVNTSLIKYLHNMLDSGPKDPDLQELLEHIRSTFGNS